jgi:hypothetical protein
MTWKLLIRDTDRRFIAEIDDYQSLDVLLRFNTPGGWILRLPFGNLANLIGFDQGIVVKKDGETILSGPVSGIERDWDSDTDAVVVSGFDDDVWLHRRLGLPVPGGPPYSSSHDVRTGVAETVMHGYVNANVGPGAVAARRVPGLVLAADGGRGSVVTGRARFQFIDELLRSLSLAGGDLGFRVVQVNTDLQFQVYETADKTATVKFSRELGNLRAFQYSQAAAETNYVYAGGGGEGTARTFVEGGDAGSIATYGRIESFRDTRDTSDTTEMQQRIDEELAAGKDKTGISISPVDTSAVTFLRDYVLGDRVTVVIDGVEVQDVVREVKIRVTPDRGETTTPLIGAPDVLGTEDRGVRQIFQLMRRVRSRVSHLERR